MTVNIIHQLTKFSSQMESDMDQQSVLAVGDQMPDLSLPTLKGGLFNLHDCRDKKYIIYMWASW